MNYILSNLLSRKKFYPDLNFYILSRYLLFDNKYNKLKFYKICQAVIFFLTDRSGLN